MKTVITYMLDDEISFTTTVNNCKSLSEAVQRSESSALEKAKELKIKNTPLSILSAEQFIEVEDLPF